jgi:hypothetical protein
VRYLIVPAKKDDGTTTGTSLSARTFGSPLSGFAEARVLSASVRRMPGLQDCFTAVALTPAGISASNTLELLGQSGRLFGPSSGGAYARGFGGSPWRGIGENAFTMWYNCAKLSPTGMLEVTATFQAR